MNGSERENSDKKSPNSGEHQIVCGQVCRRNQITQIAARIIAGSAAFLHHPHYDCEGSENQYAADEKSPPSYYPPTFHPDNVPEKIRIRTLSLPALTLPSCRLLCWKITLGEIYPLVLDVPAVRVCGRGSRTRDGPEKNHHPGRPAAQPEEHQPGNSAQHAHGDHRTFRLGQVLARVRHALRRRPAPLRGIAFGLRAPVPRSDGAARSGFHRRAFALDRHRAEDHHALAALDRRHDHGNLRLSARGLQRHRHAALPELRQAHHAPIHRADRAIGAGAQAGRPHHGPRAGGSRPQRRIQEGTRKVRQGGLRPRAHRWRARKSRRARRRSTAARITPSKLWWTGCC